MKHNDARSQVLWTWINIAIILYCTASVLYPPIRHYGPLMVVYGLLLLACFILHIRRMKADGTGSIPLGELRAQVKRGRRLPKDPLGTAAVVAMTVSSIYLSSQGG